MNLFNPKQALVLAPHTDDGEFGCGATIAKWIEAGCEVHYVAFSSCEQSVPKGMPKDVLVKEMYEATKVLGIDKGNVSVLNYEVRRFNYSRQEILEDLINIRNKIKPEVVMVPSSDDFHQDHTTISQEGLRAFKHCTVLGYEVPWNNTGFSNHCFSVVKENHLTTKIEALSKYESQQFRNYAAKEFITALATVRGVQAGHQYAEAFEVIRLFI